MNDVASSQENLSAISGGQRVWVDRVTGDGPRRRRLQELGFVHGAEIEVERRAPLGDPIEVRLGGYHLSLRREEAEQICVVPQAIQQTGPESAPDLSSSGLPLKVHEKAPIRVMVIGNPNVGKTALFNRITGLHQKVANYPGVTVDRAVGRAPLEGGHEGIFTDLPGLYSLCAISPDEAVSSEALLGLMPGETQPDMVLMVLDASNLPRNLLLFSQVAELGLPIVVALNMMDLAEAQGLKPDIRALERLLGVPVVPVVASLGTGLVELRRRMLSAKAATLHPWRSTVIDHLIEPATTALTTVLGSLCAARLAWLLLESPSMERALIRRLGPDQQQALAQCRRHAREHDAATLDVEARYTWIRAVLSEAVPGYESYRPTLSDRVDRVLLSRVWGLPLFALIMASFFALIFFAAAPVQDLVEQAITWCGNWVGLALLPEGWLRDLWGDGVVAGVGGVLVFLPQIALLFFVLAILEASGYMARGAFLLDRVLYRFGLSGRSFVPLLSANACAVPGIMAARTITDRRDRLMTILVIPFMTCAARLPVYTLVVGFLFAAAWAQALAMISLYLGGIVLAIGGAVLLRLTVLRRGRSDFLIELPPYRWPQLLAVFQLVRTGAGQFVKKAGSVILIAAIVVWSLSHFPSLGQDTKQKILQKHGIQLESEATEAVQHELSQAALENSLLGRAGKAVEPALTPLGFDWRIGSGLLTAFTARETFVATMGVLYTGSGENGDADLHQALAAQRRPDGTPLWTPLMAIGILAWFMIATQCLPTTAIIAKETGAWKIALLQLGITNALAWIVCLGIWQIGRWL